MNRRRPRRRPPTRSRYQETPPQSNAGGAIGLAIIVLVGLWLYSNRGGGNDLPPNPGPDDTVVVDDTKPPKPDPDPDPKPVIESLEGAYLIRVWDSENAKTPQWLKDVKADSGTWSTWVQEQGLKMLTYDPEDQTAADEVAGYIKAAKDKGAAVPFWMVLKTDGTLVHVEGITEAQYPGHADRLKEVLTK